MSELDVFERTLRMLQAAMLDGEQWLAATALIEEACGAVGSGLMIPDGAGDDVRELSFSLQVRGERQVELERDYVGHYYRADERMNRCQEMPYGQIIPVADMYTDEERKASPAYNEFLTRAQGRRGLNVRLPGHDGCAHIAWAFGDPLEPGGWRSAQIVMMKRLLPHLRQFFCVRRALASAGALQASLNGLLESPRIGAIQLDKNGRILAANARATRLLRRGVLFTDDTGCLRAHLPENDALLARLLSAAVRPYGGVGSAGSAALRFPPSLPALIVHIKPVVRTENEFGPRLAAALVLLVEPRRLSRVDQVLVGSALGLTPAEARVAAWMAEGRTVREIAKATGRKESSIYWHLRQIYEKEGISRQADLVRLVLSVTEFG